MEAIEKVLSEQLLKAVKIKEEEVDQQIEKLDAIEDDELDTIRRKRIQEMKEKQQQKQEWLQNGHGCYEELPDEVSFFAAVKKSSKIVCHFYARDKERCKIIDKHLEKLARKYLGTRFVYVNAEKFPFLTKRLNIRFIPTIAIIIDSHTVDYIRGSDGVCSTDDFSTEALERRLAESRVIQFTKPPPKTSSAGGKKKAIRGKDNDDDADEDED